MQTRLKLFIGDDDSTAVAEHPEQTVSVRFHEILSALSEAMRYGRTWVADFEDDEIQIPADLYEVISAYSHLRPSA